METLQIKHNSHYIPISLEALTERLPKKIIFGENQNPLLIHLKDKLKGIPFGISDDGFPVYIIGKSPYTKRPREVLGSIIYELSGNINTTQSYF